MEKKKENTKTTSKTKAKKVSVKKEEVKIIDKEVKKERKFKTTFNMMEVIVIMIITAIFGILVGSAATYFKSDNIIVGGVDAEFKELIATYNSIVKDYYDEVNKTELLEAGIKGMMDYLGDPYSGYLDVENSEELNEKIEGEYVGLGTEVIKTEDGNILINTVFKASPAEKSGIKVGDIITYVEDKKVSDYTLTETTKLIKGKSGTKVNLTIIRDEEEIKVEFTRGVIETESVHGEVIEKDGKKIGLITIDVFAKNSYKQFKSVTKELTKKEVEYLIIDVRNNTGGYLATVNDIANLFLSKKEIIFSIDNKKKIENKYATGSKEVTIPTAVLINGGSASASEVLAAALNENLGTPLIGLKTYGKGSVQKSVTLSSGATIKYTIEKWLTPKGNNIEGNGIEPTIEIEQSEEYYKEYTNETDTQLQRAIEELLKK